MKKHEEFSTTDIIDNGKAFDFGKTSEDYARYRDIYPADLFEKLHALGIGTQGQTIVDLGTGTGVIPRCMKKYGVHFIGVDISAEQIEQAKRLSDRDAAFEWRVAPAEDTRLPNSVADVVLACQCFVYFDKSKIIPEIIRLLKPGGIFAKISMLWLPFEDAIARTTENMVLKYNPDWTGVNHHRMPVEASDWSEKLFKPVLLYTYDAALTFTRDSWRGRIRACRGMGASSLADAVKDQFDRELKKYLEENQPERFTVLHQILVEAYKVK